MNKELATRNLSDFVKQAWHIVEPITPYKHGWHIDAIAEHLTAVTNGEIRDLIINIPPRHMKSLLTSVFWPMWVWTFQPEKRWLFSAYSESLAIRDSLKCRRIIQSPWYRANWGDVFQLTGDQNQKTRFENNKTGFRLAAGVGGLGTGEGGDFIVVDDPLKSADAHSQAARENVTLWWDETMSTRGNDPTKSARVIIMQRLHEQDLTGHILAKMKADADANKYELLCLPAEYVPTPRVTAIGWHDPRTEPGQLLWPERVPLDALNRLKKDLGSYGAAGQLQQEPSPSEGGILKRHWWRFWVPKGMVLPAVTTRLADNTIFEHPQVELPATFDQMLQSWDMTFKDTKGSDFVAGQVWGKVGADKFLVDQVLERLDFVKTIAAVLRVTQKWPNATTKLVEDKANGSAVISALRSKISGLIPIEPDGSKESRVYAVSPEIESGNVYLPHPLIAPWVNELINRAAAFPNAAHDDDIDAMSQALRRWSGSKQPLVAVL